MNLKPSLKYQSSQWIKSTLVYYTVIIGVQILAFGVLAIAANGPDDFSKNVNINGGDFSSTLFMFIMGIALFRENFLMLSQNGISRRSNFTAAVIIALIFAAILAICDTAMQTIALAFYKNTGTVTFTLISTMMIPTTGAAGRIIAFLYIFCIYFFSNMLGSFISVMYYRLSTIGKVIVSISVPGILIVGIPSLDHLLLGGTITGSLVKFLDFAFGASSGKLYMGVITLFILAAIFASSYWVLMRKANVRTK